MDELEKHYKELARKRASGLISDDEYWRELFILDRQAEACERRLGGERLQKVLTGAITKLILAFLPIAVVAFLAYMLLFYYPAPADVSINVADPGIIPASRGEKEAVYRALELVKTHSPGDYALLVAYVERIEVATPTSFAIFGRNVGSYASAWGGKTIRLTRGFECPANCVEDVWTGRDLFLASILIHEGCHSMQYHTGADFSEPQCYEMQFEFAKKVGPNLWSDFEEEGFAYEHPAGGQSF